MKKLKIHFVCRGNIYRSRMAELYAKSLHLDEFEFSSSGIVSDENYTDKTFISPIDEYITQIKHLDLKDSPLRRQTIEAYLQDADLIIFMSSNVRDIVDTKLDYDTSKARIWDVEDVDVTAGVGDVADMSEELQRATGEMTFEKIKKHVDELVGEFPVSSSR